MDSRWWNGVSLPCEVFGSLDRREMIESLFPPDPDLLCFWSAPSSLWASFEMIFLRLGSTLSASTNFIITLGGRTVVDFPNGYQTECRTRWSSAVCTRLVFVINKSASFQRVNWPAEVRCGLTQKFAGRRSVMRVSNAILQNCGLQIANCGRM